MSRGSTAAVGAFLFEGGHATLTVRGSSMAPTYRDGQSVTLRPLAGQPLPGCCYVFRHGGDLVIHRFVGVVDGKAVFAGDHAPTFEAVGDDSIVGEPVRQEGTALMRGLVRAINRCFLPVRNGPPAALRLRVRLIGSILGIRGAR